MINWSVTKWADEAHTDTSPIVCPLWSHGRDISRVRLNEDARLH